MRPTFLLLFLLGGTSAGICAHAQNCTAVAAVPADQSDLGGGTATAHYDGTTTFSGGQAAYVSIKNENVLGVAYELTIARNTTPGSEVCKYKAILPPRTHVVLWGSFVGEPPLGWKITVAVGSESDAGVLTYRVYSRPVRDTPICATTNEHGAAVLNCPRGTITGIQFASYGTPNGSCTRFSYGACNATSSSGVVANRCVGRSACSVPAANDIFGDPCVNTMKRLYVQATCRQ